MGGVGEGVSNTFFWLSAVKHTKITPTEGGCPTCAACEELDTLQGHYSAVKGSDERQALDLDIHRDDTEHWLRSQQRVG